MHEEMVEYARRYGQCRERLDSFTLRTAEGSISLLDERHVQQPSRGPSSPRKCTRLAHPQHHPTSSIESPVRTIRCVFHITALDDRSVSREKGGPDAKLGVRAIRHLLGYLAHLSIRLVTGRVSMRRTFDARANDALALLGGERPRLRLGGHGERGEGGREVDQRAGKCRPGRFKVSPPLWRCLVCFYSTTSGHIFPNVGDGLQH
jgi:hypothetical protein